MGIASDILGFADRAISAINPIRLFEEGQLAKIGNAYDGLLAGGADHFTALKNTLGLAYMTGKSNLRKSIRNIERNSPKHYTSFRDYLAGHKLGAKRGSSNIGQLKFNSIARKATIGVAAGIGLSRIAYGPNILSNTASFGLQAGFHTTVGAALYRANPILGLAYGGLSMVNVLRKGDNAGPF